MSIEKYEKFSSFKGIRKKEFQVLRDGDLNCKHERISRTPSIDQGIVFVEYECVHCGRKIAECIGECHNPEDYNDSWDLERD